MSHFSTLVLVKSPLEIEVQVSELLKPYSEQGEWFKKGSKWDSWWIGGRFTAMLDKSYKPEEDPDNFAVCDICNGTGTRPGGREEFGEDWVKWCKGCNGCEGIGRRLKLAFDWKIFPGDIKPVNEIKEWKWLPHAVVTPDGEWHERGEMGWFGVMDEKESGGDWKTKLKDILNDNVDCIAVVVDCHI